MFIVIGVFALIVVLSCLFGAILGPASSGGSFTRHTATEVTKDGVRRATTTQLTVGQALPPPLPSPSPHVAIEARLARQEIAAPQARQLPPPKTIFEAIEDDLAAEYGVSFEHTLHAYLTGVMRQREVQSFEAYIDSVLAHPERHVPEEVQLVRLRSELLDWRRQLPPGSL